MAVLKNPKHELFAQELAKGKTASEAYVAAGYKESRSAASRLTTNVNILNRVAELQERGAKRAEVTIESLIHEAEEVRVGAMAAKQYSAAVAAIKEKGVLSGKRIERAERGEPGDFERMTDDELREFIVGRSASLGLVVDPTKQGPLRSVGGRRGLN